MKKYIIIFALLAIFNFDRFIQAMEEREKPHRTTVYPWVFMEKEQLTGEFQYDKRTAEIIALNVPIFALIWLKGPDASEEIINRFYTVYSEKGIEFTTDWYQFFMTRLVAEQYSRNAKLSIIESLLNVAEKLKNNIEINSEFVDLFLNSLNVFKDIGDGDIWRVWGEYIVAKASAIGVSTNQ